MKKADMNDEEDVVVKIITRKSNQILTKTIVEMETLK